MYLSTTPDDVFLYNRDDNVDKSAVNAVVSIKCLNRLVWFEYFLALCQTDMHLVILLI